LSEPINEISLHERIGGEPAVNATIARFYQCVLADTELENFFNEVSMPRLKAHQLTFLSHALGGPRQYSGASMRDAHSKLHIQQRHFDSVEVHRSKRCGNPVSAKTSSLQLPPHSYHSPSRS
jgi:hemoglobin